MGVAERGDAVAVRRARGVELDVEAEGFAEVGELHTAGDAEVVFGSAWIMSQPPAMTKLAFCSRPGTLR